MTAFVFSVMAASNPSGSRVWYASSTSTNTGVAPTWSMHVALAMKVCEGTMTSSPGPTSSRRRAAISATEPFEQGVPAMAPQNSAHSAPNALLCAPLIHWPESSTSITAARISSSTYIFANCTRSSLILDPR